MIEETGYVVYPITAGIERKYLYTVVIGVAGNKGVVKGLELNFSELLCMTEYTNTVHPQLSEHNCFQNK